MTWSRIDLPQMGHAESAGLTYGASGSPVYGGGRVWILSQDAGRLYAASPTTGRALAHVSVGRTTRFATPALYGDRVVVPTYAGITIVRVSP